MFKTLLCIQRESIFIMHYETCSDIKHILSSAPGNSYNISFMDKQFYTTIKEISFSFSQFALFKMSEWTSVVSKLLVIVIYGACALITVEVKYLAQYIFSLLVSYVANVLKMIMTYWCIHKKGSSMVEGHIPPNIVSFYCALADVVFFSPLGLLVDFSENSRIAVTTARVWPKFNFCMFYTNGCLASER